MVCHHEIFNQKFILNSPISLEIIHIFMSNLHFFFKFLELLLDSSLQHIQLELEPRNRIFDVHDNDLVEQNGKLSFRIGDNSIRKFNKNLKTRMSNNNDKSSNGTTDESN